MGWAARNNLVAQAAKRGEIAPKPRRQREHFKRADFKALWAAFDERIGVHFGRTGKAILKVAP